MNSSSLINFVINYPPTGVDYMCVDNNCFLSWDKIDDLKHAASRKGFRMEFYPCTNCLYIFFNPQFKIPISKKGLASIGKSRLVTKSNDDNGSLYDGGI
jgi:hypothetical protein